MDGWALTLVSQQSKTQALQIQKVHLGPCSNACNFCCFYLVFIPVLSRSYFTSRTPKTRRYYAFFLFKFYNPETSISSAVNVFVHAIRKRSKKYLAQKVDYLGSLIPIPMIQPPFNSSCVALQYESGTEFFHQEVLKLHCHKN